MNNLYEYIVNAFTRKDEKTNLEVNNLNVDCITSKNNKFELDAEGNLTVKSITAEQGLPSGAEVDILNSVYPIGSIYMSTSSTNPGNIFGGTWVSWGARRVPVGVNASDNDFKVVEKMGGTKSQELRALIGATNSDISRIGYEAQPSIAGHAYSYSIAGRDTLNNVTTLNHSTTVLQASGGNPTTIQPYITCYMWKRTQ